MASSSACFCSALKPLAEQDERNQYSGNVEIEKLSCTSHSRVRPDSLTFKRFVTCHGLATTKHRGMMVGGASDHREQGRVDQRSFYLTERCNDWHGTDRGILLAGNE